MYKKILNTLSCGQQSVIESGQMEVGMTDRYAALLVKMHMHRWAFSR